MRAPLSEDKGPKIVSAVENSKYHVWPPADPLRWRDIQQKADLTPLRRMTPLRRTIMRS